MKLEQEKMETVKKLLGMNLSVEQIQEATGVSIEIIKSLSQIDN